MRQSFLQEKKKGTSGITRCNRNLMAHVPKVEAGGPPPAPEGLRGALPPGKTGEKELVRRAQAGDMAAYEELLRTHQQRVFAVVGGILRRREDVEDVAQQVFMKAYFSLKRFDLRSAFGTWLYKIAVNECWDYLRKKKVRRLVYEADLSEEQIRQLEGIPEQALGACKPPEDAARLAEQSDLLQRLLGELEEKDRLMLVMKEVEGFSVEEIGEVLGLNVNTVKVRLFRARGRLVEIYRKRLRGPSPTGFRPR